jgi:hypothetical protein
MRSGVLTAPLMDLLVDTPASVVASTRDRRSRMASTPLTQPFVVVAGATRAGKSSLVNALIEAPGCAPVDAPASTAAWLVFRHGDRTSARAFVPGHREPRPIGLDGLRVGDTAAAARGGQSRPPRRIEITHPAALLARVALVDTPGVGDLDAATADVVLDAAERGAGLVFVADASAPLNRVQLDLLAAAAGHLRRIVFVLTKIDEHESWRDVLAANRALLTDLGPQFAEAPWLPVAVPPSAAVALLRGTGGAIGAVGVLRGASGAVAVPDGSGVGELRQLLAGWADDDPPDEVPQPLGGVTAVTVSSSDNRWQALLDREIRNRQVAATQRVSIDLATIHVRCVQELGSGQGCPELPYVLDRSLHSLSVRASRQLEIDTAAVIAHVFTELLDYPPDKAVLGRITAAARRTVDTLQGDDRVRDRALLLTTTSAVAALSGPAAVDSLSAVGLPEPPDRVLPAIGVGLTTSCYLKWPPSAEGGTPKATEKKDCRRWLQQALRVVEAEVQRELAQRYGDLRQALAIIAADAVDHGVLLA